MRALGVDGAALVVAGDVLAGTYSLGASVLAAPGEWLRLDEEGLDNSLTWRVIVHAGRPFDYLEGLPVSVRVVSLAWVVQLLHNYYEYFDHPGGARAECDQVLEAVGWVAQETRRSIRYQLARLRPHVDRDPHPAVVAEAHPVLRGMVLDAAHVFGGRWTDEVLGPWGHLVRGDRSPSLAYVAEGHSEVSRFLARVRGPRRSSERVG